jgi:ribonucleoside-diphosphate reductase alpha chain
LTANARDDGTLREIFIHAGKHGSTLAGLLDTIASAVSIGLRNGVTLQNYVDNLAHVGFSPHGATDDPDIRHAASIIDYLFRRLALDFLRAEPPSNPAH